MVMGAVVLASGLAGCQRRPVPPARPTEPTKPPATFSGEATGIRLRFDDAQGRPVYEVKSDSSKQSGAQDQANVTLTDTMVTLYHEGQPDIVVTAPNTKVKAETGELVMWGGLTAEAPRERASFRVERLTWSYQTKKFTGTGDVYFSRPPVVMRAKRIAGRTPVKTVDLDGGVTMDVDPKRRSGNG